MKTLGVPQPDSEVINSEPKVLLIGFGWVNQYCNKYFKTADIFRTSGFQKKEFDHYDLAIIGVPTPMDKLTGQCDTSIVEEMVKDFKDKVDYFLIKSTVEIGTTDRLRGKYDVKIAMSPEYIGETLGHPLLEARRDAFQIIGGEKYICEHIADMWITVLNANAKILLCEAKEAEIIKYCENYWLMRQVDYWNDVLDIADTYNMSFHRIREGLLLDSRFSRTHSFVYKTNRGWSGKCLPKDMNALAFTLRQCGYPLETVEHLIDKNFNKWRKNYKNEERLRPAQPRWK